MYGNEMAVKKLLKYDFALLLLVVILHTSDAQLIQSDTSLAAAYKDAVSLCSQTLSQTLHIFNGR